MTDDWPDSRYVRSPSELLDHARVGTMLFLRQPRPDGAQWALVTGRLGDRLRVRLLLRVIYEVGQPPCADVLHNCLIRPVEISVVNQRNAQGTWDAVIESLYRILSGEAPTRPFPMPERRGPTKRHQEADQ